MSKAYTINKLIPFAEAARDSLLREAENAKTDPSCCDLEPMYRGDAEDYNTMVIILSQGDLKAAMRHWGNLDTAARDQMGAGCSNFSWERFQINIDQS